VASHKSTPSAGRRLAGFGLGIGRRGDQALIRPQRDRRLDAGGAPGGGPASEGRDGEEQREELSYLLVYLRDFASPEGVLPTDFDALVRESFGDLLAAGAL